VTLTSLWYCKKEQESNRPGPQWPGVGRVGDEKPQKPTGYKRIL